MSHHQTATQNHNLNVAKKPLKMCLKFKYLGIMVKIKRLLNLGNACYHAVHNLLPS
jgi:hypothetical protein